MTSVVSHTLEAALNYVRRGWPAFPLYGARDGHCTCGKDCGRNAGKHPLLTGGFHNATTDKGRIQEWWARWPDANVGIRTGAASGLVVLDIDSVKGGDDSLERLARAHGPLPDTVEVLTGGGGRHLYFRHPGGVGKSVAGLAGLAGLDVRADGGYVVAPPSMHISGKAYAWEILSGPDAVPLAPAPAWLINLANGASKRDRETETAGAPIPEGRRNATLTSLAGTMRRRGMTAEEIEAALLAVNASRCQPSLPEEAIRRMALSVGRYEPAAEFSSNHIPSPLELNLESGFMGREVNGAELQRQAEERGDTVMPYLPFLGQDGFIVRGWTHLLAGYPKAGKTELVTRVMGDWHDEAVLYLTEEPEAVWGMRLAKLPHMFEHVTFLFALGVSPDHLLARIHGGTETVVIIDTMRNLLGFVDETDNSAVTRTLVPYVDAARRTNKTVLLLHHDRKGGGEHGEGIAGAHAFLGVVDVALELRRDSQSPRRRLVRGWGRVIEVPELAYEMSESGDMVPLGSPQAVALEEVKGRVLDALSAEWKATKDVRQAIGDPTPSDEQVRQALLALAQDGVVGRDPPIAEGHARGRMHRWRLLPPREELSSNGTPLVLEPNSPDVEQPETGGAASGT